MENLLNDIITFRTEDIDEYPTGVICMDMFDYFRSDNIPGNTFVSH